MIGDITSGLAAAFAEYLGDERKRTRESEDRALDEQMQMIKALADRPDFNPALVGRALTELTQLSQAKAGKRKAAKGMAGFTGASELPLSQLLAGIQSGTTPMQGRTTEAVPTPPVPTQVAGIAAPEMIPARPKGIDVAGGHVPFTGESVLQQPVPVPPQGMPTPSPGQGEKLASAARDVQNFNAMGVAQGTKQPRRPVANQPVLRDPMEMMEERAQGEGILYKERAFAQRDAQAEVLRSLGVPEEQIRQALLRSIGGQTGRPIPLQTHNYIDSQGQPFTVMFNPETGTFMDPQGTPMTIPPGSRRIGIGPTVQYNTQVDDFGNVSYVPLDRNTPGVIGGGAFNVPGVQGRTSPAGPAVIFAGPDGANTIGRFTRTGTEVMPGSVGGAPAIQPPNATERASQVSNLTALQALQRMQQMYKDDFVGPAAGRWLTAMTMIPDVPGVSIPGMQIPEGWGDFQATTNQFTNMMIKAITGAQMSEPEATRIKAQLPQIMDLPEMFHAKLNQSLNNIGDVVRAYVARGIPVPQELLDAAKTFGIALPQVNQGPANNAGGVPPPPAAIPGRGVKLRAPDGTVKEYVDPAMIRFLESRGAVRVR